MSLADDDGPQVMTKTAPRGPDMHGHTALSNEGCSPMNDFDLRWRASGHIIVVVVIFAAKLKCEPVQHLRPFTGPEARMTTVVWREQGLQPYKRVASVDLDVDRSLRICLDARGVLLPAFTAGRLRPRSPSPDHIILKVADHGDTDRERVP